MTTAFRALALLAALAFASGASAQTPPPLAPTGQTQLGTSGTIELQKDPVVAMYLSASLPGLGQIYTGDKKRGFLFMASVIGAFGAAYASYEPALLHLADYDRTVYGGNGDGLISTLEAQNWQERRFEKTAFDSLSSGRKPVSSPVPPSARVSIFGTSLTRGHGPTTTTVNSRSAESASPWTQAAVALASRWA
jgi:hypothetical protein